MRDIDACQFLTVNSLYQRCEFMLFSFQFARGKSPVYPHAYTVLSMTTSDRYSRFHSTFW